MANIHRLLLYIIHQFLSHHFADQLFVLSQAILESIQKVEEELTNVSLLVNSDLLARVVDDGVQNETRVQVLDVCYHH